MKLSIILILSSLTSIFCLSAGEAIYRNDFSSYSEARDYSKVDWLVDWLAPEWEKGIDEGRVKIVKGEQAFKGGTSLAVETPNGGVGTKGSGALWKMELPSASKMVRLKYRVKFGAGFNFVRGGKLPGLAGGSAPTGRARSTFDTGWCDRLMWRTDDLVPNSSTGEHNFAHLVHYLKHPKSGFNQDGKDEDQLWWLDSSQNRVVIKADKWYNITQLIRMNDPGSENGRVASWLSGKKSFDQSGYSFRDDEDKGIDILYFCCFFGGGGSSWATTKKEVIYFDDFEIKVILD